MALPFFLSLTGKKQGKIEGNNTYVDRDNEIQCHALEHSITIPYNPQTGIPSGLRQHNKLIITKSFDKASPKLYQALVEGERMSNVELKFYRIVSEGQQEHYFTIKLTDAAIVEIKPTMKNIFNEDLAKYDHLEDVAFTYAQISWRWEPDGIESMDKATMDKI